MYKVGERINVSLQDIVVFSFVLAVSAVLTKVGQINNDFLYFTAEIAHLEAGILPVFQIFSHSFLTFFMSLIYLILYPFLLIGTYFYLKKYGSHIEYAKSYVLLLVISAPFFYFVPVKISGFYLKEVEPLLYGHSIASLKFFGSIGDYYSALPSLHTGLSALAAMHLSNTKNRACKLGWVATFLIILSTLYLGIHWLVDIAAGLILAYLSFVYVKRFPDFGKILDSLGAIQKYLMRIIEYGR